MRVDFPSASWKLKTAAASIIGVWFWGRGGVGWCGAAFDNALVRDVGFDWIVSPSFVWIFRGGVGCSSHCGCTKDFSRQRWGDSDTGQPKMSIRITSA